MTVLIGRRRVKLAATFRHRNRTSEIEYGFPVAPTGAKRRVLMHWIYPDGYASDWAPDSYSGAVTRETFDLWRERLQGGAEVAS